MKRYSKKKFIGINQPFRAILNFNGKGRIGRKGIHLLAFSNRIHSLVTWWWYTVCCFSYRLLAKICSSINICSLLFEVQIKKLRPYWLSLKRKEVGEVVFIFIFIIFPPLLRQKIQSRQETKENDLVNFQS